MIIGIGGSSNSGKSMLANELAKYYKTLNVKVVVLCQDDFVYRRDELSLINNHPDWEVPTTIKIEDYILAVKKANEKYEIVLCEGLFAFWFKDLNKFYDKTIFLKIDKETFLNRKQIDERWGLEHKWYINYIWKNHLIYGQHTLSKENFLLLNATKNINTIAVANFIK